jgi:hypothetical protein
VARQYAIMVALSHLLGLGLFVLPAFAGPVSYSPPEKNCTYGPTSRSCWRDGFNILSDYTNHSIVPPGKLVEVRYLY